MLCVRSIVAWECFIKEENAYTVCKSYLSPWTTHMLRGATISCIRLLTLNTWQPFYARAAPFYSVAWFIWVYVLETFSTEEKSLAKEELECQFENENQRSYETFPCYNLLFKTKITIANLLHQWFICTHRHLTGWEFHSSSVTMATLRALLLPIWTEVVWISHWRLCFASSWSINTFDQF